MTRPLPKPDRYAKPAKRIDYRELAFPKDPPQADAKYRAYAKGLGCQLRGKRDAKDGELHFCTPRVNARPVIDFAHYKACGKGIKGNDRGNGMGLCHGAHMLQHYIGWRRFARRFDIDPVEICQRIQADYDRKFSDQKGLK